MVRARQIPRMTLRFVVCVNRWMEVPFINLGIHSSKYFDTKYSDTLLGDEEKTTCECI